MKRKDETFQRALDRVTADAIEESLTEIAEAFAERFHAGDGMIGGEFCDLVVAFEGFARSASGIEARQGGAAEGGSVHESPTGAAGDAQ